MKDMTSEQIKDNFEDINDMTSEYIKESQVKINDMILYSCHSINKATFENIQETRKDIKEMTCQ